MLQAVTKIVTVLCVLHCTISVTFVQTTTTKLETDKVTPGVKFTAVEKAVSDLNGTVHYNGSATTESVLNNKSEYNDSSRMTPPIMEFNATNTEASTVMDVTTQSPDKPTIHCPGTPQKLDILPGQGWDNLESVSKGQIFMKDYLTCTTTIDGVLLIPDGTISTPLFESSVDPSADIFRKWDEYYPLSAKTVTKETDNPNYATVSGSFSPEYQRVKKDQVNENAVTVRTKLENKLYEIVFSHQKMRFTDEFQDAVQQLAEALYNNDQSLTDYNADALVQQYGTHMVQGIVAGGMVVIEDSVKANFLDVAEPLDYSQLATVAKANFLQQFNMTNGDEKVDPKLKEMLSKYQKSTIYTQAKSYGGDTELPFSYNDWQKTVPSSPAVIDRSGIYLDKVVTEENFPSIPPPFVHQMKTEVKNAIDRYYVRNTHRGCTEKDAPNFAFVANKEDGTCQPPATNYTFGGMYQECTKPEHEMRDLCFEYGLEQINPLTGDTSCPKGYEPIILHTRTLYSDNCPPGCFDDEECLKECNKKKVHIVRASYRTFWCAAVEELPQNSGSLFGGLYSSKAVNIVTGRNDCPSSFTALPTGQDLHVCLNSDTSLQEQYNAVPFGGFFSCVYGNPLALPLDQRRKSSFADWPMRCPDAYSQQVATVDRDCAISYCVAAGQLNTTQSLPLIRPPYTEKPNATNQLTVVSIDQNTGEIWFRVNATAPWVKATSEQDLIDAGLEGLLPWLKPQNATSETTTQKATSENATPESVTSENTSPKASTSDLATTENGTPDDITTVKAATGTSEHATTENVRPGNGTTGNTTSETAPPAAQKGDGLGGGVIAGIVIVSTLGVLAVVGLGGYAYKKKSEQRQRSDSKAHLTRNDSVQQERSESSASQQQPHHEPTPTPEESFDSPA